MSGLPPSRLRAPMRRLVAACAMLAGLSIWPAAGHAGALYRCTGSSGEVVFSSSAAGYQGCSRIAGAPEPVRKKPATTTVAAPSFAGVKGSVGTTAGKVAPVSAPQSASLAWVQDSVATTARVVAPAPAPAPAGKPGQWSYSEASPARTSSAPDKPVANVADDGSRVLRGAVYRVVRKDGSVEYTNLRPAGEHGRDVTMLFSYIATCVACNLHSNIRWDSVALNLEAYADVIRLASQESGVDEAFLRAIIHAESAFNPRALSIKGAQGLMQLMPATATDMGVRDAFDTAQNIRGGARYLGMLIRTFNGDERLAAAAYNSGPANVQKYNGVPPFAETQVYVERVGTLRRRYGLAIHPSGGRVPVAAARVSAIQ
ncbi:lytic transglycosylase domain-containing protein [Dyella japonica]|uniref:lytic transglycosylase domain-containing protein n=1 Tax=Dyella japonica TaxID=231455 RepID=UPI0003169920|nr:lytic transglycosylase domain-containing protein [Dyella japonica]